MEDDERLSLFHVLPVFIQVQKMGSDHYRSRS